MKLPEAITTVILTVALIAVFSLGGWKPVAEEQESHGWNLPGTAHRGATGLVVAGQGEMPVESSEESESAEQEWLEVTITEPSEVKSVDVFWNGVFAVLLGQIVLIVAMRMSRSE